MTSLQAREGGWEGVSPYLDGNGCLLQHHGGCIVGHRPHHVEVPGGVAGEVAAQVREGHKGVPQQAQRLPHQVDDPLVLFTALRLPNTKGSQMGVNTCYVQIH